jgi:type II secretory pathway pseudopilin PulG
MRRNLQNRAFTITELVLVVSAVGALATFALPAMHHLRQQQRLSSCLSNLGRLGAASLAYAAEDSRQQIVPLHAADVTTLHGVGWGYYWGWRTALPHAFGGQTATTPFPVEGGEVTVLTDAYWGSDPNPWGAATRPLNPFVEASLESFHCPADTGFPAATAAWSAPEIPAEAAGVACFDMLGNSYKTNRCGGAIPTSDLSFVSATVNVSPLGHTPEYILEPSRTVLYCDPLFYSGVRSITGSEDPIVGWHGFLMADNVAYADGSARFTQIGTLRQFSAQDLQDTFCTISGSVTTWLRRGSNWQMDCYPAPLALIMVYTAPGQAPIQPAPTHGWPYERMTVNDNPFGPGRDGSQTSASAAPDLQNGPWMVQ